MLEGAYVFWGWAWFMLEEACILSEGLVHSRKGLRILGGDP